MVQVKQRLQINELVYGVAFFFAKGVVLPREFAVAQIVENFGQVAACAEFKFLKNFLAGHALAFFAKQVYDFGITLGIVK